MKNLHILSAPLLALSVLTASAADNGVAIDHLGVNNSLIRVTGDQRYLLLPVEDAGEEARLNLLLDGKQERSLVIRLAKNKVDYHVPVDLTPYKGHTVALNVITPQGRSSIREAKEDACWSNISLSDTFDTSNREKYRPLFHHTPPYGWMNDPNGMFYKDGMWHLYYQHNPYGSKWQNLSWGHSTSTDLINWQPQPEAIEPNGLGLVFSGSCVVDSAGTAGFGKNAVIALYTSADVSQTQSLAWSTDDGKTFNIYPGNPILTLESEARDPNMFWHAPSQQWVMLLAHALDHEMLIFTSPDLKDWTLQSSFGKGLGCQDGVWECPDLFELPVEGSDEKKWVLLCNINPGGPFGGSATQYFTGNFDGKTFTPDTDADGKVPTKWMDYGKDNYATVSWSDAPDSRRTVIGWMSNWQYAAEAPTLQYRSANTLPREMGLFRGADGQIYLSSAPSPELLAMRGKTVASARHFNVGPKQRAFALPTDNDGICEITLRIEPTTASSVTLTLANHRNDKVDITYDPKAKTISMDRRNSGITDFSQDFPAVTTVPLFATDGSVTLRIYVDRSSIELFADGGRSVMTNTVFPTSPYTTLFMRSEGGKTGISDLKIYSLKTL